MMNPLDALTLARTKLRSHRIRTGVTVAIAGLLFGLIIAALFFVQGVFTSVDKYSDIGLNNRILLNVTHMPRNQLSFDEYNHRSDQEFIREVEAAHAATVAKKQAASKKYSVPYDPKVEDPSPITIDPITREKVIDGMNVENEWVQRAAQARRDATSKPFSIDEYLSGYKSVIRRGSTRPVSPVNGALTYMKQGNENQQVSSNRVEDAMISEGSGKSLTILDGTVARPFITSQVFDPTKGEIPVVMPFSDAEKLLGLTKLSKDATPRERQDRLREVRGRISEVTASFCYRSNASRSLMGTAASQQQMLKYLPAGESAPALLYNAPDETECAAITVKSDTRSAAEKQLDENRILFEKEVGTWQGEVEQQKITVRGVGISGDTMTGAATLSPALLVTSLLNSTLGFGTWSVPSDLFEQLPENSRPAAVFDPDMVQLSSSDVNLLSYKEYLVEFTDKAEARALLERTGAYTGSPGDVFAYPFGSGTLFIDEVRSWVERVLFWALVVVGAIATLTLWGVIGRTVADSRRESAVFRAIGATRFDIASIYGLYAFLLSLRVVVFAVLLGLAVALGIDIIYSGSTTIAAQLAYAAVDTTIPFRLISVTSWHVLVVVGVIVAVGLLSSIVPILLGVRRNPITDMRDDG